MQNKKVFLIIVTGLFGALVTDVCAEYMELQAHEVRAHDREIMDTEISHDNFYEPVHENAMREQQTRADDDPAVQSCIAEAIVEKYCS